MKIPEWKPVSHAEVFEGVSACGIDSEDLSQAQVTQLPADVRASLRQGRHPTEEESAEAAAAIEQAKQEIRELWAAKMADRPDPDQRPCKQKRSQIKPAHLHKPRRVGKTMERINRKQAELAVAVREGRAVIPNYEEPRSIYS